MKNVTQDLDAVIDMLYAHPNLAPFISRQLIQQLVSSNPSPAYAARVSRAFEDNGDGVRGDMKGVLRAILLDNSTEWAPRTDMRQVFPNLGNFAAPPSLL